jgi:hypothetical protein
MLSFLKEGKKRKYLGVWDSARRYLYVIPVAELQVLIGFPLWTRINVSASGRVTAVLA